MSLKNPKHLLIIGAVVVALMVGTVLLGNYANILPGSSDACSQAKTCPAAGGTSWPVAQAAFAENAKVCSAEKTATGCCPAQNSPGQSDEGCCPAKCCPDECEKCCCPDECDKCCCPDECDKCCCPKVCPPDCTKPCCAEETTTGCCPMSSPSATTNSGCCPKTSTATE